MKPDRSVSRIGGWGAEHFLSNKLSLPPGAAFSGTVAFAVAPPVELARRALAALLYHATGRVRISFTAHAVEDDPANTDHSVSTLGSGLVVKVQGEALQRGVVRLGGVSSCAA